MNKVQISEQLELLDIVHSKIDKTIKYVFFSQNQIIEFSYIDKNDGKDIICVPSQTGCNLGCKFCFLSDIKLRVRNLASHEITRSTQFMIDDLNLINRPNRNHVLLISFMGCGEPLLNIDNVIAASKQIAAAQTQYKIVRFAIASLIPSPARMLQLTAAVAKRDMPPIKFHLSLHSPSTETRQILMPGAAPIEASIAFVEAYMHYTRNSAEIHYALMDGVNDSDEDLSALIDLLNHRNIPVKFLMYNEKPSAHFRKSRRVAYFRKKLEAEGIATEFYIPPGADIGSSCGQFLMDYYEKYNKNK